MVSITFVNNLFIGDSLPPFLYPSANAYFSPKNNPYYLKVIWMEGLLTFTFTVVFLLVKNKYTLKATDEISKGVAVALVFMACLSISYGSGGCLNPALAIAQTTY